MSLVRAFANKVTGRQKKLDDALFKAIRDWDEPAAIKVLDDGANPDARSTLGIPALMESSRARLDDITKALLAKGADPNAADQQGRTALYNAVSSGEREIVDLMMANGGDPLECGDMLRKDMLLYSVTRGHESIAKLLIAAGTDIVQRKADGKTLVMLAAEWGQERMIEMLAAAGADITEKTKDKKSLISIVAAGGFADCIPVLAKLGADMQEKTVYGCSLLFTAIEKGKVGAIQPLVDAGIDPALVDNYNRTPFSFALQFEQIECAEALYKMANLDVDALNKGFKTELFVAMEFKHVKTAQFLIDKGADPNISSSYGYTPLREGLATAHDDNPLIKALLDAGADTRIEAPDNNHRDKINCTDLEFAQSHARPYHRALVEKAAKKFQLIDAVTEGDVAAAQVLINEKAPIDFADSHGISPLIAAIRARNADMVEFLLDNKATASPAALAMAVEIADANAVRALAKRLPDAFATVATEAALLKASEKGDQDMVKALLDCGAKAAQHASGGDCPAHAAIRGGSIPCLQMLLDAGARVEVQGAGGATCLSQAEASKNPDMLSFVSMHRSDELESLAKHATHTNVNVRPMKSFKFKGVAA